MRVISDWKLSKVVIRHPLFVKGVMDIGFIRMYPFKRFSIPPKLVYLIDGRLVGFNEPGDRLNGLEVTAVTRLSEYRGQLTVEMLPPKDARKVRKYVLVVAVPGKSTGAGSYRESTVLRGEEYMVWRTRNVSGSGNHWIDYYVFVLNYPPPENAVVLYDRYVTSCGNVDDSVILPVPNRRVPVEETIESMKLNEWVRYRKVKDNVAGEVIEVLDLEFHEARKTSAYTTHDILTPENVAFRSSTKLTLAGGNKTHWVETYRILKHPVKVRVTRYTNRGNKRVYEVVI